MGRSDLSPCHEALIPPEVEADAATEAKADADAAAEANAGATVRADGVLYKALIPPEGEADETGDTDETEADADADPMTREVMSRPPSSVISFQGARKFGSRARCKEENNNVASLRLLAL